MRHVSADFAKMLVLVILALLISLIGTYAGGAYECSETGTETNRPTKYRYFTGCYVEVNGEWIPAKSWRGVDE